MLFLKKGWAAACPIFCVPVAPWSLYLFFLSSSHIMIVVPMDPIIYGIGAVESSCNFLFDHLV